MLGKVWAVSGATTQDDSRVAALESASGRQHLALVIAAYRSDASRVGEVILLTDRVGVILGRGGAIAGEPVQRAQLVRQYPGRWEPCGPLEARSISRQQLALEAAGDVVDVQRVGKAPMRLNGTTCSSGRLEPGDTLAIGTQLLLVCVLRPGLLPRLRSYPQEPSHEFGKPDRFGLVGESPALWRVREQAALLARANEPALICGPPGVETGPVAQTIHGLSELSEQPLLIRSSALLPDELGSVEIFGNLPDCPTPGLPEREGLLGEANGTTLYLDQVDKLSSELQTRLAGVLASGGHYKRLGASEDTHSSFRLLCSAPSSEQSHELFSKLRLRAEIPGLEARREDVPLIIGQLLEHASQSSPQLFGQFRDDDGNVQLDIELVEALLRHKYRHNREELENLLWLSVTTSTGEQLVLTDEVRRRLGLEQKPVEVEEDQDTLDRSVFVEAVRHALRHFQDSERLAKNPLIDARVVRGRARSEDPWERAEALRDVLRDCCHRLSSNSGEIPDSQLLEKSYFGPSGKQLAVASELGISLSTYRRYLTRAVGHLAESLWRSELTE